MAIHLIRKLEQFTTLSGDDKQALERAAMLRVRRLAPRQDAFREGDRLRQVSLILEGWACRYKVLEDGRRQITAFVVPGDLCDMRMFILKEMDHSLAALSPVSLAEISEEAILALTDTSPRIGRALWWSSLVEAAIQREWTVSLGQRDARERLAHLFCELFIRLRAVGLTNGSRCELPVTQAELGDAMGISTVHVNRTLMDLREAGLINLKGKTLTILDLEQLKAVAMFNANHLHLDRDGRDLDANDTG